VPAPGGGTEGSLADLVAVLSSASGGSSLAGRRARAEAAHALVTQLQAGGRDASEEAYARGALPALLGCLTDLAADDPTSLLAADPAAALLGKEAGRALWLLLDDSERCLEVASGGGNGVLLRLAAATTAASIRGEAVAEAVSLQAARALTLSLYSEARSSALWKDASWEFLPSALQSALTAPLESEASKAAAPLCDVAALWIERLKSRADAQCWVDAVMPALLERLAASLDDVELLQHACRLTCALAKGTEPTWPAELVDKSGMLLAGVYRSHAIPGSGNAEVMEFARCALTALSARREAAQK